MMTESDLGLADAYIQGDVSFEDEEEGLSNTVLARIKKWHEVIEIGCGWGYLAVEVVKRTGCKYTGITLSEEQLKYAQAVAKKEGLEDNIKFLLCDYREVPKTCKYDRIISV
ncbi:hypothetical protein COLO4_25901 [Corchorus olitorius]|uniref:Mycolic acid cyclopropane synthase n=1 Tax=Corchorus olitorius TaxID=93759 RepID=A0A1R3HZH3_9ROSI|nr:hypothetical protein COLO4_25901 [Corchorus olitorius]